MTLEYANTRVQFGKSIGKFQAIQQQLATMAEHVLAGAIAAESAFQSSSLEPTLMAAAIAKSRASEASRLVAATSHAVHGAIGMTDEYELSLYTRRMHDWRICNGSELDWNQLIGKAVLQSRSSLADFVRQH
jgi:alkylation response protein AidB-like acyl-CoA dehydrogenase